MSEGVINQMILLFGLMAVGYVCYRTKVLDEVANARLSAFLLKAAVPLPFQGRRWRLHPQSPP